MCGIAALLRATFVTAPVAAGQRTIEQMTAAVAHRGPDGHGVVRLAFAGERLVETGDSADWCAAIGHRRLSILDLSDAGRQPMCYRDALWITYNGEVYNYVELRQELEQAGHHFHSHSDTEVILAAYDQWGTDCFQRLRGMWGLVIVDARRRVAILSRDRLGIKPLYFVESAGLMAVASEIKQFLAVPGLRLTPDQAVLRDYVLTGYEQEGRTFFEQVRPVPPGAWLSIDLETNRVGEPTGYWFPERIRATVDDPDEAAGLFRNSLEEAVRIHLRSDVPVGCALSGGLDSSSISACIARLNGAAGQNSNGASARRLQTFSVVFPGTAIDERAHVETVVESVGSQPHYITPTPEQFLADLDRFVWIHDEPVGTLAQYAGYALARLTREAGVPVTLNGQGGDEVLAGYWQSYFMHLRGLLRGGRLWRFSRHFAGAVAPGGNPELPRQVPAMLRRYRARRDGSRESIAATAARPGSASARLGSLLGMSEQERRVFEIREMYLPRLLKWDDRNFMAFGVEGRYPFLDHVLIELALSFTPSALYSRGWTKEPLRRGLAGMLPQSILRRRTKFGFETPQNDWLRGGLRPALESWLKSDSPAWKHVERTRAVALSEQVFHATGPAEEPGQALFRLFLADRWLRLFCR